jgi:hypothetical protein
MTELLRRPSHEAAPGYSSAVSKLKLRSTILDGEVVAADEIGIRRFQLSAKIPKATNGSDFEDEDRSVLRSSTLDYVLTHGYWPGSA